MPVIKLSAYNTNFKTEAEFDGWIAYVCAKIDERCSFEVGVESAAFTGDGATFEDEISSATDEEHEIIKLALEDLWIEACGDAFALPAQAAAQT